MRASTLLFARARVRGLANDRAWWMSAARGHDCRRRFYGRVTYGRNSVRANIDRSGLRNDAPGRERLSAEIRGFQRARYRSFGHVRRVDTLAKPAARRVNKSLENQPSMSFGRSSFSRPTATMTTRPVYIFHIVFS